MTDFNLVLNKRIKEDLWPSFKELGYKKSGNNFRYYNSEGWGRIVQFQKSNYNTADELSFTVNVGLYLPEVERYLCFQEAGPKFQESACVVRKRLGSLTGRQSDTWIKLNADSDEAKIAEQLVHDFKQYIHPFLASIKSREDIFAILVAGYQSHYPSAQIQAMFYAGYQDAALELFRKELTRSKSNEYYQRTLRAIANELGLSPEL